MALDLGKLAKGLIPILAGIAPTIIGGLIPGGGVATKAVLNMLGVKTEGRTEDEVLHDVGNLSFEKLQVLKNAEVEEARIAMQDAANRLKDKQDARAYQATQGDKPFILTLVVFAAFFLLVGAMYFAYVSNLEVNTELSVTLGAMVGTVATAFITAIHFNFGTSIRRGKKTEHDNKIEMLKNGFGR